MRKPLQEITDKAEIREFLSKHRYLFLSIIDGDEPYVVPLNYGYTLDEADRLTFYLHTSVGGRLYEIMERNGWQNVKVSFGIAEMKGVLKTTIGYCEWDTDYRSILGSGVMNTMTSTEEKEASLRGLMASFGATENVTFMPHRVKAVTVYEIKVSEYHMKKSKGEISENAPEAQ